MPWDHPFLSGVLRAERWVFAILRDIFFSQLSFDKGTSISIFVWVLDVCNSIFQHGPSCYCIQALPQVTDVTKGVKWEAWELSKCSLVLLFWFRTIQSDIINIPCFSLWFFLSVCSSGILWALPHNVLNAPHCDWVSGHFAAPQAVKL